MPSTHQHVLDNQQHHRRPHTRLLRHVFRPFALYSFSALHNISSSVLSDIVHSAFFGQSLRTTSTRTMHPTTGALSVSTTTCFSSASAFWLHQKKIGYIGGDTKGSWIEQRHRQSNLPLWDTFSTTSSSPVQLLLGILPQFGVLDRASYRFGFDRHGSAWLEHPASSTMIHSV